MKKAVVTAMLGASSTFLLQSEEIRKLRHELQYAASDTSKVWMLRDLAYYYQSVDPDSATHYAQQGAVGDFGGDCKINCVKSYKC